MDPLADLIGESPRMAALRRAGAADRALGRGRAPPAPAAHARRDRLGQGPARPRHPSRGPARGAALHRRQLRGHPRDASSRPSCSATSKGAFTDARQAKPGLFQPAHRGTLFLDEIGLLAEPLQAKLLTVLEERTVRRLGSTQTEAVDVWVVAATNEDFRADVEARRFRQDLYHRLAVITLDVPAAPRARRGHHDAGRALPGPRLRGLRPAAKTFCATPARRSPLRLARATSASSAMSWSASRSSATPRSSPPERSRYRGRRAPARRGRRARACCATPCGTISSPR